MDKKTIEAFRHVDATYTTKAHMDHYLETAEKLQSDPEREKRESACICKWCFYMSSVGVDWTRPCIVCGVEMPLTRDKVCLMCAKEHHLCVKCGGDLDLRIKRRKW